MPEGDNNEISFVGREEELLKLADWAKSLDSNPMFVFGPRGIGKTALIRHFEYIYNDLFDGGIFNFSASFGVEQIYKLDIKDGKALVLVDDIDLLKPESIQKLIELISSQESIKLVFSGVKLPKLGNIEKYLPNTIKLQNLNPIKIIESRIHLATDSKLKEKIIEIALNNEQLFDQLLGTPRHTLALADKLISDKERDQSNKSNIPRPKNIKVDQVQEESGHYDYYSYILAILLSVWSQMSSIEMEDRVSRKINNVTDVVAEALQGSRGTGGYVVTTFVNLRGAATIEDNVITVLAPNQRVELINLQNGWAYVRYLDYISEKEFFGYVHAKFIKLTVDF